MLESKSIVVSGECIKSIKSIVSGERVSSPSWSGERVSSLSKSGERVSSLSESGRELYQSVGGS